LSLFNDWVACGCEGPPSKFKSLRNYAVAFWDGEGDVRQYPLPGNMHGISVTQSTAKTRNTF
jgi:hypothetical protein